MCLQVNEPRVCPTCEGMGRVYRDGFKVRPLYLDEPALGEQCPVCAVRNG
jgi:hypothetical protein